MTIRSQYLADENLAHLVVEDSGPGIAPDDLEAIFNVFVSRKGGRGTGLGLPVSRKILEEHGGQILVESQSGQGSRFTLELPITQQSDEQPPVEHTGQTLTPAELPPSAHSDASSSH